MEKQDDIQINNIKSKCRELLNIYLDLVDQNVKDPLKCFTREEVFYLNHQIKEEKLENTFVKFNDKMIKISLEYEKITEEKKNKVEKFIERAANNETRD